MFKEQQTYSGKFLEEEMLGKVKNREKESHPEKISYLPYNSALSLVKRVQPGDPNDPEPRFANDLHATIAELLDLDEYKNLRFYTAVGSELDVFHGVDAFFEYDDPKTSKTWRITLDITKNPKKDYAKADVLLQVDENNLEMIENKVGYDAMIEDMAKKILVSLKTKQILAERRGKHE